MTTEQLALLLTVPLGGGALALWALWLNRPATLHATEPPDTASIRADVR